MSIEKLVTKWIGVAPLLLKNGRGVDPDYYWTRKLAEVSKKRSKTEADRAEMSRCEFMGALYLDEQNNVILPQMFLNATIRSGAKLRKLGKQVQRAAFASCHSVLIYPNPTDPDNLWTRPEHVNRARIRNNGSGGSVIRTRPQFPEWSAIVEVEFNSDGISREDLLLAQEMAGAFCGTGDWRPLHGRFKVEVVR